MSAGSGNASVYSVWSTAWGPVGAVSGARGLVRFVLPGYQRDELCDMLSWEHPGALRDDGAMEQLAELTRKYFNAGVVDFSAVACRMPPQGTFTQKVLIACKEIPYGQTCSYSSLAEQINRPDAPRAVAAALGKNKIPLVIPCHRVIYADGRIGGYSAPGGSELKKRLLDLERSVTGCEE